MRPLLAMGSLDKTHQTASGPSPLSCRVRPAQSCIFITGSPVNVRPMGKALALRLLFALMSWPAVLPRERCSIAEID